MNSKDLKVRLTLFSFSLISLLITVFGYALVIIGTICLILEAFLLGPASIPLNACMVALGFLILVVWNHVFDLIASYLAILLGI